MSKAGKKRNKVRNEERVARDVTMSVLARELAQVLEVDAHEVHLCCEETARAAIAVGRRLKDVAVREIAAGGSFNGLYVGRTNIDAGGVVVWTMRQLGSNALTTTKVETSVDAVIEHWLHHHEGDPRLRAEWMAAVLTTFLNPQRNMKAVA